MAEPGPASGRPLVVTHLIAPVAFGGGEALLTDLLGTPRADLDEDVVTVGEAPLLRAALAERGIACSALGTGEVGQERAGRGAELRAAVPLVPALRRIVRDRRPDVLHTHGFPPSLLGVLAGGRGGRRVYTHHYERQPPGRVERAVLGRLFGRYDALTTPADHLTAAMNGHFPGLRQPFETLRIGIDDRFAAGTAAPRWRALVAPGATVGVCVGRLVATKNQRAVVAALAALPDEVRATLALLLVGTGPDEAALRAQVAAAGLEDRVAFVGQVPRTDVPDLLASVDFGVFPTLTEASSLAAAEALVAGLPVVSLDIPSMRETVGDAGILTDEPGLGAALAAMAARHAELAPVARARGATMSMTTVRGEWAAVYRRVAGRAASAPA